MSFLIFMMLMETCADVLALIQKVQDTVFTATGVTLEPEVKIIR